VEGLVLDLGCLWCCVDSHGAGAGKKIWVCMYVCVHSGGWGTRGRSRCMLKCTSPLCFICMRNNKPRQQAVMSARSRGPIGNQRGRMRDGLSRIRDGSEARRYFQAKRHISS
jgi:hypothetical protein